MNEYLKGEKLYGDDFTAEQIAQWYREEEDAFFDLYVEGKEFSYDYSALDKIVGFPFLTGEYEHALGIGSGYGVEFLPVLDKIKNLTIIENSEKYWNNPYITKPINYCKAAIDGTIPAADKSFDLVICFSTLHHIPNASYVISEFVRVLKPGGILFLREPIVSMGDWTKVRKQGLTKNERGIPLKILRQIIQKQQLHILKETIWCFRPLFQLVNLFSKKSLYNNRFLASLDIFCSALFRWNLRYHAEGAFGKLRPTAVFYVLKK